MGKWTARLHALVSTKTEEFTSLGHPQNPQNFVKLGFEGFEGCEVARKTPSPKTTIDVRAVIAEACLGVSGLTPGGYYALLSADDIEGIREGDTTVEVLKAYAPLFAEGLSGGRLTVSTRPEPTLVRCENCRYFIPDLINPAGGIGNCAIKDEGTRGSLPYPFKRRYCKDFRAVDK